jgi:hypothetical protein
MKVKLLKKVRKRFEIFHLPKGLVDDGTHYDYNLFRLVDNNKSDFDWNFKYAQIGRKEGRNQWVEQIFDTEEEGINYLKSVIIKRLKSEGHKQRKDKTIQIVQKKVWYK